MEEEASPSRRRKRRSRAEIEQLLERFECSGKTQAAFCREHALSVPTFCSWRRKRQGTVAPPGFRAVRVGGSAPGSAGPLVRLPDGIEIAFPFGAAPEELCRVVALLRERAPW